jgi:tetratricopeptide (TPR) repeat protein
MLRIAAGLWLALLLPAFAQAPATATLSEVDAAQLLLRNDRAAEAKRLLEHRVAAAPDDSEALFLLGPIAVEEKAYDAAIGYFRRILVREPDAERVRLELARAFFLKKDYENADRQFRFARAGDVPDTVKANIDQFLGAINRLREWTVDFSVALAPDTNQNAATAAAQVDIFGLPFTLDPNARRQSGVGAAGEIQAEWSPLLSDTVKGRFGVDASRLEYSGGDFDDMQVSLYAGPQFLFGNWDFSVLATGFQRWYGNAAFVSGLGGRLAATYGVTSDLLVGASVGGQAVSNAIVHAQSGPFYSASVQATYILSPSSLVQALTGFNRQEAGISGYSYGSVWIGAGYQQDLPMGFSAGFQPAFYVTRYDAALAAFGRARADDTAVLSLTLLNRRLDYHGFTPRLSWIFTDQHSNIRLFAYSRSQFQLGLTRVF